MKEKIVSKAYAQSIYGLCTEQNIDVADQLTKFTEVINENNDLETVLFMDVFTLEEKMDVTIKIMDKMGIHPIVKNFMSFLIMEKRMGIFPLIFKDIIVMDDHKKGFLRGSIEGSEEIPSESFVKEITDYLVQKLGKKPELEYKKNEKITAGYRVTVEDLQLDASLDNQLNKLKDEILNA